MCQVSRLCSGKACKLNWLVEALAGDFLCADLQLKPGEESVSPGKSHKIGWLVEALVVQSFDM